MTLVIHTPRWRVDAEGERSFEDVLASGVGDGYAIPARLAALLSPGARVVLLCKDQRQRAEGVLERLRPTGKTGSGMVRYEVTIRDLQTVPYEPEALGRTGVAVI
jgi:hypothetical protein